MAGDPSRLTDREKEVLRLILLGHDAKSIARERGLSVHTVNEKLRSARHKLGVSSSREAARLLHGFEGGGPNNLGYKEIGVEPAAGSGSDRGLLNTWAAGARRPVTVSHLGLAMALIAVTIFAALWLNPKSDPAASAPRVVATNPRVGAVVPSGPLTLSVTFDRPMRRGSYSFVQVSAGSYPECAGRPAHSADGRTFTLRCTVRPGRSYEIWLNRQPYMNFTAEDGTPALPYQLTFRARK
jgi:DNA-binding CsgD family transcriptional regulator